MKHLISLSDWSKDDLERLLELAVQLKTEWRSGGNAPVLAGKVLAMVFQKPSLRTRVSFEMAMKHLGGDAMMLGPSEIGLGQRESIGDVARVLSGYVQGIMARVFDHDHVVQLARYASVPVINGLSDDRHPCQALADILTIHERFGSLQGLKFAFVGDGNNVAASSLIACAKYGLDFAIASPPGYALNGDVIDEARGISDIKIETFLEPEDAVRDADVVYTDTWVSMGQEDEVAQRLALFEPYQINAELLKLAKPTAIVLHCLPAHRGQEITDEVADGPQSMIFPQAENRLHAQKAVLVELMK
jgi:ornithine carbamoyltransferase